MAATFPSNPTIGQIHNIGVKSWKWNGAAWDSMSITDTQVTRAENAANRAEAAAATIGTTAAFSDANPVVKGSADATKQVRFEVDGLTTGTTRVLTMPDKDGTIATTADITDVILIAAVIPTAVAAIDLPNVFSDEYDYYEIVGTDLRTSDGNPIRLRFIADGTTVVSSSAYYGGGVTDADLKTPATYLELSRVNDGGTTIVRASTTMRVTRAATMHIDGTTLSTLQPNGINSFRTACAAFVTNCSGFRLYPVSGTFQAGGRISVYGYRKN